MRNRAAIDFNVRAGPLSLQNPVHALCPRTVGAAYGKDNILGRWRDYAHSGHGGNKKLLNRKAQNFVFSILQIVAHDMEPEEVPMSLMSSR
jgi:hypothetical protein